MRSALYCMVELDESETIATLKTGAEGRNDISRGLDKEVAEPEEVQRGESDLRRGPGCACLTRRRARDRCVDAQGKSKGGATQTFGSTLSKRDRKLKY